MLELTIVRQVYNIFDLASRVLYVLNQFFMEYTNKKEYLTQENVKIKQQNKSTSCCENV